MNYEISESDVIRVLRALGRPAPVAAVAFALLARPAEVIDVVRKSNNLVLIFNSYVSLRGWEVVG